MLNFRTKTLILLEQMMNWELENLRTKCPDDYADTIEFSDKTEEDTAQISDYSEDSSQYFDAAETPEDENLWG